MKPPIQLVVLSLESWDDVWRRNQLLVAALIADLRDLRVLFVEPPVAALRNLRSVRSLRRRETSVDALPGVAVFPTAQWFPDRLMPYLPMQGARPIRRAVQDLEFDEPVLWVNNHSLARFALSTRWPVVYDITDDWLLAQLPAAKRRRAELDDELLLRCADAVVVCSPGLAASRGERRDGLVVIPNGVDLEHFSALQPRPIDLGSGPVAVYVGTLHDERLDVRLCCDIADGLEEVQFVYVGPLCLRPDSRHELERRPNVRLLGPRPYAVVPAYLQHADAIFVPHVVSAFTESLDPIKARECLAVGTPTVATPVAGFRELGPPIEVFRPEEFIAGLRATLAAQRQSVPPQKIWTWADAAREFRAVLESVIR